MLCCTLCPDNGVFPNVVRFVVEGASNFREAMRMGAEVYQQLKKVVKEKYGIDGRLTESGPA